VNPSELWFGADAKSGLKKRQFFSSFSVSSFASDPAEFRHQEHKRLQKLISDAF
jgi:hypothetical protein